MADLLDEKKQRHRFRLEEDSALIDLVTRYGVHSWALISAQLPGRNARQCRDRWNHYLSLALPESISYPIGGRRLRASTPPVPWSPDSPLQFPRHSTEFVKEDIGSASMAEVPQTGERAANSAASASASPENPEAELEVSPVVAALGDLLWTPDNKEISRLSWFF
jgi:hypothetical protein